MKKKIAIALATIFALFAGAIAVIAYRIGDIAAAYKPQLQATISEALGAQVTLGDLSLSLIPQPKLSVSQIAVKGDTSTTPAISVRSLHAGASLLPLLQKKLVLSSITLDQPTLTLVKTPQGTAIEGLHSGTNPATPGATTPPPRQPAANKQQGSALDIAIDRIIIKNGTVTINDTPNNRSLTLKQIELDSQVALSQNTIAVPEGQFSLEASAGNVITVALKNLLFDQSTKAVSVNTATVTTTAGVLSATGSAPTDSSPGELKISTERLDLAKLQTIIAPLAPAMSTIALRGEVASKLALSLNRQGVTALKGPLTITNIAADLPNGNKIRSAGAELGLEGSPQDLQVSLRKGSLQYNDVPLTLESDARVQANNIALRTLTVKGFGGEIQAPLRLQVGTPTILAVTPSASSLAIQSLLKAANNPAASFLSGTISAFNADFSSIALDNPAATTSGPGSITVKNGIIKGLNLPNQLLTKIDGLPFISGNLRKRVPPEFESLISRPDTTVHELVSRFSIKNSTVAIQDLFIASDLFNLKGSGTYSLSGETALDAQLLFSPELSKALVERVKELRALLNQDNRLVFPLTISGKAPAVIVTPDLKGLAKSVSVDTLKETLGAALKDKKGFKKDLGTILGF